MARIKPVAVLNAHVHRFNDAIRSGDFAAMVAGFTPDAEMAFEGVPVGQAHSLVATRLRRCMPASLLPMRFACSECRS